MLNELTSMRDPIFFILKGRSCTYLEVKNNIEL